MRATRNITRRAFLKRTGTGALVSVGVMSVPGVSLGARASVEFAQPRACVGDEVRIVGVLPGEGPIRFRLDMPSGRRIFLDVDGVRDGVEVGWRIPLDAVPDSPGVYPIRVAASRGGPWVESPEPLEIVVNRFAFGM